MIKREICLKIAAVLICAAGTGIVALAQNQFPVKEKEYAFSAHLYGPGEENLSASDEYARYQWGLKNDGEFERGELVNKFRKINPLLADYIDLANYFGLKAPVEGPDAYEVEKVRAVKGVDINVLPAWQLYDESKEQAHRPVVVAVIDTGVDISHPDLKDSIWINEDEIPGDEIDNDGNGYIDDVNGWDFYNDDNVVFVGEEDSHGTHAAGTIAANRGLGGTTGIADNNYVKIMPLKALGTSYGVGDVEAVIDAIRYAEANGASICNLSFGTTIYYPLLEEIMKESKMLFVVSAGNGDRNGVGIDIDQNPEYPATFASDNIITVANLMFDGNLDRSSNYGITSVDIAAPGTHIVSTTANNSYGYMSGTSMSAPMVTGAAAFLYSCRSELSLQDVRSIILNSARKMEGLEGKVSCGGMLDVYAAMTYGR